MLILESTLQLAFKNFREFRFVSIDAGSKSKLATLRSSLGTILSLEQVSIRGIGEHELVCLLRSEVEALPAKRSEDL
jgi:hypothetical protein